MSQYSTSKMLGRLAGRQGKSRTEEEVLAREEEVEDIFSAPAPQLKPSTEPEMKEVLTHILGTSYSKKYSPVDNR